MKRLISSFGNSTQIAKIFVPLMMLLAGTVHKVEAGILYGVSTATNSVYRIDSGTGSATFVTSILGRDLAFAGAEVLNGKLYVSGAFATGLTDPSFGTVDLGTGIFTKLNGMDGDLNWWGLAADSSTQRIFTVDSDNAGSSTSFPLKYTDATNNSVTNVANMTGLQAFTGISGLAHDDTNGILYGVGQQNNFLYTLNKTTGVATAIGSLGLSTSTSGLAGLAFDQSSQTLFLTNRTSNGLNAPSALYTVNVATGQATLVGMTGVDTIDGLAWSATSLEPAAVPEPTTIALWGIGALGMGLVVRRKKRHTA
ncbi:MAG: DUF4394 domain-containing protein [Burkholderiaceae bacterium]|jgi:hypothetical protein